MSLRRSVLVSCLWTKGSHNFFTFLLHIQNVSKFLTYEKLQNCTEFNKTKMSVFSWDLNCTGFFCFLLRGCFFISLSSRPRRWFLPWCNPRLCPTPEACLGSLRSPQMPVVNGFRCLIACLMILWILTCPSGVCLDSGACSWSSSRSP